MGAPFAWSGSATSFGFSSLDDVNHVRERLALGRTRALNGFDHGFCFVLLVIPRLCWDLGEGHFVVERFL